MIDAEKLADFLRKRMVGVDLRPEDFKPPDKTLSVSGNMIPMCLDQFRTIDEAEQAINLVGHYCVSNGLMVKALTKDSDRPWVVNFVLKKQSDD